MCLFWGKQSYSTDGLLKLQVEERKVRTELTEMMQWFLYPHVRAHIHTHK